MIQTQIYKLYFASIKQPDLIDYILLFLYIINIFNILTPIIFLLEQHKYGKSFNQKIIHTNNCNFVLKTYNTTNTAVQIHRTRPYIVYELILENGYRLKCADNHLVYCKYKDVEDWSMVKYLSLNDYILTDTGWIKVKHIKIHRHMEFMVDVTMTNFNDNEQIFDIDHSYMSNGILSHNTTTTAAFLVYYLIFHSDKRVMVVANKGRTGTEIIGKIKEIIEDLPFFLKPGIVCLSSTKIKFENGCQLTTAAASKSPATGDSINLLYIDEAALIPANIIDEYWASVYPTLSSFRGSQVIMSSTPRGKGNLFYKFFNGAQTGTLEGWISSRVDWWEVPGRDENWVQQQIQDLGEDLFKREVELSFEDAGSRLISARALLMMERLSKKFINFDFYSVPKEISDKIIWDPDFNPNLLTYNELLNRRFLIMVDTAQGIENGAAGKKDADYNVLNIFELQLMSPLKIEKNRNNQPLTIFDTIQYKQVGVYMDNFKDEAACAEACKYIVFQILKCGYQDIDNTRVLLEMNFNGNNWITKFKDHPSFYDLILMKTISGQNKPGGSKPQLRYGFRTSTGQHGKKYYCEKGAEMMHKRQIIIRQKDDNINHSTIGELTQFGKNDKGTYCGQSCHDDLAVSALFVSIAQETYKYSVFLETWFEQLGNMNQKLLKIKQMLNMYVEQEAQFDAEQYKMFYSTVGQYFNNITHTQNGYSSMINQANGQQYQNILFHNQLK